MRVSLIAILALLSAGAATSSAQQRRTFILTKASAVIASEAVNQTSDSTRAETRLNGQSYSITGGITQRTGRLLAYDGRVNTPGGQGSIHIDFLGNAAKASAIQNGTPHTQTVVVDSTKPLLLFENLLFTLLPPQFPPLAVHSTSDVQVLIVDHMLVQTWSLERSSESEYILRTLEGLEMQFEVAAGSLLELRVPAQHVVLRPAEASPHATPPDALVR